MKLVVVGCGHVGLVTATTFGQRVTEIARALKRKSKSDLV